jgi:hypothetical protein
MVFGKKSKNSNIAEVNDEGEDGATNYVDMRDGNEPNNFVTALPKKQVPGIGNLFRSKDNKEIAPGESSPRRKTMQNDDISVASESVVSKSRLFFSSHEGDDYDNNYDDDDDLSQSVIGGIAGDDGAIKTILRFRGFSTSIQDLFLDEALVCASVGCFGLFLSNRTEYLLQMRNDRRGVRWGRSSSNNSLPSRVVAYALLLTLFLVAITFCIWGFGDGNASPLAQNWYDGYDVWQDNDDAWKWESQNKQADIDDDQYRYFYADDDGKYNQGDDQTDDGNADNNDDAANAYNNDDANAYNNDDGNAYNNDDGGNYNYNNYYGNRQLSLNTTTSYHHRVQGIFKIRDIHEGLWQPAIGFISDEWNCPDEHMVENKRQLSSSSYADEDRDLASDIRISIMLAFVIVLGILGRRRRMRTRYYLVRARAQEDHLFYASNAAGVQRVTFQDSREDQYEGACSHTLCGCYPVDPALEGDEELEEIQVDDEGVSEVERKPQNGDCIARGFKVLLGFCCGAVCKFWCQCLSICALAQEAREIRLLVPTRYQRLDFITHQPFSEYYREINDLRRGWLGKMRQKSGFIPHFNALSHLSRYILVFFSGSSVLIGLTLAFNPLASFSWPDMVILVATFLQSFIVLYIAHWIFHKSDLSLDAVIKLFASGFLIAVPTAFVFEGILVNLTLLWGYFGYWIGESIAGDSFTYWVIDNYHIIWVVGEFVNAYVVAAVTEELSKYYTFRCVEHPDLLFLTGLQRSSQDERAIQGGMVKYPFGAHQIANSNKKDGTSYDDDDIDHKSQYSGNTHRTNQGTKKTADKKEKFDISSDFEEDGMEEEEPDVRTYRQKAAAVTTGMISVAVGLACAENFVYVFLLGGTSANSGDAQSGGILEEWLVLLFRSLFPVHALAAAMQSVNVTRKFIECREDDNKNRIGVGKIVLPAILMHGTFDAVLLAVNVYIESSWEAYLDEHNGNVDPDNPPYNSAVVNIIAFSSISFVLLSGLAWYYREHRSQRQRLIVLEQTEIVNVNGDDALSYKSPSEVSAPGRGDIELV